MMKKLLFPFALLVFSFGAKAQITQTINLVSDTLHYYYNKHYYITGGPQLKNFPYTAGPALHNITHVGSKFESKDSSVVVFGLEGFSGFASVRTSQASMAVHLYLCELDANGMPKLPALDSVTSVVTNTNTVKIGGNFKSGKSYRMTKDYAVLMKNASTHSGDSVKLIRTAAKTYTAWAPVGGPGWRDKYSDGNGFVRYLGKFYSTTNFTVSGFGNTTDYEFLVAPRVRYTLVACHIAPSKVVNMENICTWEPVTFTNTSSWMYTNKMFNFIEFNARWNKPGTEFIAWTAPAAGGFPTDSAITWFFRDQDNGQNKPDPRVCLPRAGGNNLGSHYSDSTGCFDDSKFIARLKRMDIIGSPQITAIEQFTICYEYCNDGLGVKENNQAQNVKLYPNPASAGKTTVYGLDGSSSVFVYDVLGQLVYKETTDKDKATIDLSKQPNGNYIVRIVSDTNKTKVIKVIKQD